MDAARSLVIDHRTGRRGSVEEWVDCFTHAWAEGAGELDAIMGLLSPDVRLAAPGLRPTVGIAPARAAFERTFAALPDLTASVVDWAFQNELLFIEMRFRATVGAGPIEWLGIDQFVFAGGHACKRTAFFDPAPIRRAYLGHWRGWRQLWQMRRVR